MKTVKLTSFALALTVIALAFAKPIHAQEKKKSETVEIKSSVVCGMCEAKVKKELSFEKGVTDVQVNLKEKLITVQYRPDKTDVEKIKTAITKIGYDADDLVADEKAYEKLPACCKRDVAPH